MINLHEKMLPTLAGVEPATSWSPVGRRIQLSHRGRLSSIDYLNLTHFGLNRLSHTIYWKSPISILGTSGYEIYIFLEKND